MSDFQCDKCGFVANAAEVNDACPNCGFAVQPATQSQKNDEQSASGSIDSLFDLGARNKSESKDKLKGGPEDLNVTQVEDSSGTSARQASGPSTAPSLPLAGVPTLQMAAEEQKSLADMSRSAGPSAVPKSSSSNEDALESLTAAPAPLLLEEPRESDTVVEPEIDADDLAEEVDTYPGQVSMGPPLLKMSTLELNDEDLMEVSESPQRPPPQRPPLPRGGSDNGKGSEEAVPLEIKPRSLRGRVAFPIGRLDETPPPSTLPPGVDELAVAGAPPLPTKRGRPLRMQTERLIAIKARKRKKVVSLVGAALCLPIIGLAGVGVYYLATGSNRPAAPGLSTQIDAASLLADAYVARAADMSGQLDGAVPDAPLPDRAVPPEPAVKTPPTVAAQKWPPGTGKVASSPSSSSKQRPDFPPAASAITKQSGASPTPVGSPKQAGATASSSRAETKTLYQSGLMLLLRGQLAEAAKMFNATLAQDPSYSLAYRGLGLAYEKMGRRTMAKAAFIQYLAKNPGAPDTQAIRKRIENMQ